MIPLSPIRSDGTVERLDNGRSRSLALVHRNRSRPDSGYAERSTKGRSPGPNRLRRARKQTKKHNMMSRSAAATYAGRASSMRRLRRRATYQAAAIASRPYCRTNGCASFLDVDRARGIATCPVCGYRRRAH